MLASLPSESEGWTAKRKAQFIETFKSVLDFVIPVKDPTQGDEEEDTE